MKINTRKLLLIATPVLVLASLLFVLEATNTTSFFNHNKKLDAQREQESAYNNSQKEAVIEGNGNPSSTDAKGNPVPNGNAYSAPDNSDSITIYPSQQSDQVVISTKLFGYSDGTCKITLTNGGEVTSQTAQVLYAPSFSTCAGFSVPVKTLGTGNWSIVLEVISGGKTLSKSGSLSVK